jgi:hypothetical protein
MLTALQVLSVGLQARLDALPPTWTYVSVFGMATFFASPLVLGEAVRLLAATRAGGGKLSRATLGVVAAHGLSTAALLVFTVSRWLR